MNCRVGGILRIGKQRGCFYLLIVLGSFEGDLEFLSCKFGVEVVIVEVVV